MADTAPLPSKFILVVENDADLRETLHELLREEGYAVEVAQDGVEAERKLRNGPLPSLLLLDLALPGLSGANLLEVLKSIPQKLPVNIVVVTGDVKAAPSGVSAILRKPFEIQVTGSYRAVFRPTLKL